ncbi:ABC transporter ATP-binding protein [Oceanobacillus caeni]
MEKPIVKFSNVSKRYDMFKKKSDQLLDILMLKKNSKQFAALSDISFEIYKGETIGIIGINGSGKSTLSNLLAQITPPSTGDILINGETSLVAISAGLNNHLTGLENIELKCLMHGLNKEEIEVITPKIIEFADIGDFITQPIKSFSSGMKSRLGFAISVHIQPDILIIDEALSVGDSTFYQKCLDKFSEFKSQGRTIIFISHSLSQVKSISDRIMWLNFGRIEQFDETSKVAKQYSRFIRWFNELNTKEQKEYRKDKLKEQYNVYRGSSRKEINKKRRSYLTYIQLIILVIMFFLSTLFMLIDNPLQAAINHDIFKIESEGIKEAINDNNTNLVSVNEKGYIIDKNVIVYSDKELENEFISLPFSTEVFVTEEDNSNTYYKVKFNHDFGYIRKEKVLLNNNIATDNEVIETLEDFLPLFPKNFAESYEYLFLFLNTQYRDVKASLQGLSKEYNDKFGRKVLVYETNKVSYIFDENDISVGLEVRGINTNSDMLEELISKSNLYSNDKNLVYLEMEDYKVVLDIEDAKITFYLNKSR